MTKLRAIRRNDDGSVDDVAIACDMFRLEQMDNDNWWAAAYVGGKSVMFSLKWNRKTKNIDCVCYEDTLGCIDDTAVTV